MNNRSKYLSCILLLPLLAFQVQTADFDSDGKVDFADFLSFASAFGSTDTHHDLSGNGRVDFPDFLMFATQFSSEGQNSMPDQDTSEAAVAGFDQRVDAMFRAESGKPLVHVKKRPHWHPGAAIM